MCSSSACAGNPSCINQNVIDIYGGGYGCSSSQCYNACGVSACESMCQKSCNGLATMYFTNFTTFIWIDL